VAHVQFAIGQMTFTLESLKSTLDVWMGDGSDIQLWTIGLVIFCLYSPLTWVRTLAGNANGYVFAMCMIAISVVFTAAYAFSTVRENGGEPGPDVVAVNKDSYWNMIGFAFFMYEGIGCLLPIMHETKVPNRISGLTVSALATLTLIYIFFSELCYYTWGTDLNKPIVTEMLPADNRIV